MPDPRETELRTAAIAAAAKAYCPYSRYPVGAAVLTKEGRIFSGCNVENASFGLTICAERNAIFQAVAAGHREIAAVAVYTDTAEPTMPCGACRQVIHEFSPDAEVLIFSQSADVKRIPLRQLFPESFGPTALKPEE